MNLLYIHTHDSGRYFSPYGYSVPSDHLLAFAKDATTFTNGYCVNPTCSPSRASMLTGIYPHQNGMLGLAQRGFGLNDTDQHLCNFLKRNGYHTVLSGIQHEVDFYTNVEASKTIGYHEVLTHDPFVYQKEDYHLWDQENAQAAADWLKHADHDQPFFMSYGMHSTHRPFPLEISERVNENYVKPWQPIFNNAENRHDTAQYLTSAQHADECFKIVIDALKEAGCYENTIILFTTDHGVAYPFNKCYLSDKGTGVSLIMRVPDSLEKGNVCDALVSQIDVFPTLCDLLKLDQPDYLEGKSFSGCFYGLPAGDEYVYSEINFHTSYEPCRAVRSERYKYIRYYDRTHLFVNPSNTDSNKVKDFYMENGYASYPKAEEAFYDLIYDPDEMNNLIDHEELHEIIDEFRNQLHDFQVKTNDPLLNGPLPVKPSYKVNKPDCIEASSKNPEDYLSEGKFY